VCLTQNQTFAQCDKHYIEDTLELNTSAVAQSLHATYIVATTTKVAGVSVKQKNPTCIPKDCSTSALFIIMMSLL